MISLWELIRIDKCTSAEEIKIFLMNLEVYGSNYKLPSNSTLMSLFEYPERREEAAHATSKMSTELSNMLEDVKAGDFCGQDLQADVQRCLTSVA